MKKIFRRLLFLSFSLMMLINLSGCAKVYKGGDLTDPYPLNYNYFWDKVFVQPIAWALDFVTSQTGSYALAIVIVTLIVRTILFPVYTKSNDSSIKMQAIQPEVKKIQEKYQGNTDPESRNKMQLEIMQLYRDNDVHMLAGCLMPLLQMPVFLAMYNAVIKVPATPQYQDVVKPNTAVTELFGINLAKPDPYYILPVLVGLTAIFLQYITMYGLTEEQKSNGTMKAMMWIMPAMMFLFSFRQASALSLYWIVGNVYSALQIIVVKKPFSKNKDNKDKNVVKAKYKEVK